MNHILLTNLNKIHTTELGLVRISKNLSLGDVDVVDWCKRKIENADTNSVIRKGKNWYVHADGIIITVNAHSYTIITAHIDKAQIG